MREEIKMKQTILIVALILLFCAYYLTPQTTIKNEDSVKPAPCITNTQMQSVEISGADSEFEKQGNAGESAITHWGMDNFLFPGITIR